MNSQRPREGPSLVGRSVNALKWGYAGVGARVLLQVVAQILLARLLGPSALGVVAAAVLMVLISCIVVEMGLGPALIQAKEIGPDDIAWAFTRVMIAALCVSGILLLAADPIARHFEDPRVAPVLRWMTLAIIFQSAGAIALALLRRNMDGKSVQIAHVAGYFLGFFVVGMGLALQGAGEWSLVGAWLTQTFVTSAIQYARAPHPVRPTLRRGKAALSGFGLRVTLANMANWSVENVDNAMVGRAFGTAALGAYSIAYSLLRTPANHLLFGMQQVIQPFTARASDEHETMRTGYCALLWVASLITLPIFLSAAAVAHTIIDALYGPAWSDAALLLVPLAAAMPLHAVQAVGGPVLWGSGLVNRELVVSISVTIIIVVLLALASTISVVAMAWAVWLGYLVRACWITSIVSRKLGLSTLHSLSMLRGGLLVAVGTAPTLLGVDTLLTHLGIGPFVRLGALLATGAAALPLFVLIFASFIVPSGIAEPVRYVTGRLPSRLRSYLDPRLPRLTPQ
jgi:O-antigen/teichoic acid export membrane protein